jgi:non-heme chloroperoxidase
MSAITTKDGTHIYYKDWGSGPPVVFSHGWPLNADAWESQMVFLASHGYRCIAHDRRGHGRSSQPWHGNEMDTYADDLADLFKAMDLKGATLFDLLDEVDRLHADVSLFAQIGVEECWKEKYPCFVFSGSQ